MRKWNELSKIYEEIKLFLIDVYVYGMKVEGDFKLNFCCDNSKSSIDILPLNSTNK